MILTHPGAGRGASPHQPRSFSRLNSRRSLRSGAPADAGRVNGAAIRAIRRSSSSSGVGFGVRSSYRCRASAFGTCCSVSPRTTTFWRRPNRWVIWISSPSRISRFGFAEWPFTSTLPPSHARLASERVLDRQAMSSQTSRRTIHYRPGSTTQRHNYQLLKVQSGCCEPGPSRLSTRPQEQSLRPGQPAPRSRRERRPR